jgi:hypothetical protein
MAATMMPMTIQAVVDMARCSLGRMARRTVA